MSLRQQIRIGGGGLAETSMEELAAQTGRTASPTSPLEGKTIGGNEHQSKMLGTKDQKAGALRQSIRGETDLSTARRREGSTKELDVGVMKQSSQMAKLEGLEQAAQAQLQEQLGAQTASVELSAEEQLIQDALDVLTTSTDEAAKNQALLTLNQKAAADGLVPEGSQLNSTQILDTYAGIADVQLDNMAATDVLGDLGITLDEEGKFNGIEIPEGMSVQQLIDAVDAEIAAEYSKSEEVENRINDPRLGPAERAEARKEFRDMGGTGTYVAESQIEEMYDEIADANTVEFMGKEYSIEELLDSEEINAAISNALDSPEGKKELMESHPELGTFFTKYEELLKTAETNLDEDTKAFNELQLKNSKFLSSGTAKLDENLLKNIIPGYTKGLTATDYSTQVIDSPIAAYLQGSEATEENKAEFINALNTVTQRPGISAEDIAGLNDQQITALGFKNGVNSDAFKSTEQMLNAQDALNRLSPEQRQDPNEVTKAAFGVDYDTYLTTESEYNVARNFFGLPETKVDLTNFGNKTLAELAGATNPIKSWEQMQSGANQNSEVFDHLKSAFKTDSVIDKNEIGSVTENLNMDAMETVNSTMKEKADSPEAYEDFLNVAEGKYSTELDSLVMSKVKDAQGWDHVMEGLKNPEGMSQDQLDSATSNAEMTLEALNSAEVKRPSLRATIIDRKKEELELSINAMNLEKAANKEERDEADFHRNIEKRSGGQYRAPLKNSPKPTSKPGKVSLKDAMKQHYQIRG